MTMQTNITFPVLFDSELLISQKAFSICTARDQDRSARFIGGILEAAQEIICGIDRRAVFQHN